MTCVTLYVRSVIGVEQMLALKHEIPSGSAQDRC